MKKPVGLVVGVLLLFSAAAYAVPTVINYQGVLTDDLGAVFNGTVSLTFTLFDQDTAGTAVWSESHSGVAINNGVYSIALGSVNAGTLTAELFSADDLWLEVTVNGETLSPRQRLTSVPYAKNADLLGGVAAATYLQDGGDNGLVLTGTFNNGVIPVEGAGTRMMWYPKKAAFRTGQVYGDQWDNVNIGQWSVAMGGNTTARGQYSTAMGYNTTASSTFSTSMGNYTIASGQSSVAMGSHTEASGSSSTAMGSSTTASNMYSTAMGSNTEASGYATTAMGIGNTAKSYAEAVIGSWDTDYIPVGPTSWSATDRLFVIGNGKSDVDRSNAMVVLKNGNTGLGTSTPTNKLEVVGNIGVSGTVDGRDISADGTKLNTISTGAADTSNDSWTGTANVYTLSGNVGIGTATPTSRLDVLGSVKVGESNTVNGSSNAAIGILNTTSNRASAAIGESNTASNQNSLALGLRNLASGQEGIAIGSDSKATGFKSIAMGFGVTAESYMETVLGRFDTNYTPAGVGGTNLADRLFVIGNGGSDSSRADAMVILKNGDTGIGTASPTGRLEVYKEFGNGSTTTSEKLLRIRANYVADTNYRFISGIHGTGEKFYISGAGHGYFSGGASGPSWTNTSSREFKENISKVSTADQQVMLASLMDMDVTTYRYKQEHGGDGTTKVGFIAEEMPKEVLSKDGKGVDLYELITYNIAATQVQQQDIGQIKGLKAENQTLQAQVDALQAQNDALRELVCQDHPTAALCL
jgi:hypothetical protein